MGFVSGLKAATVCRQVQAVKQDITISAASTDMVDYAGFNLRIAKWAKSQGIQVVCYIPPKIWAGRERLKPLTQYSDVS